MGLRMGALYDGFQQGTDRNRRRNLEDETLADARVQRERRTVIEGRQDTEWELGQADKAHARERRTVDEGRQDEDYARKSKEYAAQAEQEGMGELLKWLDKDVAMAEQQFNAHGVDKIVPGTLKYDPATGIIEAQHEGGKRYRLTKKQLESIVHGAGAPYKLGEGEQMRGPNHELLAENDKDFKPAADQKGHYDKDGVWVSDGDGKRNDDLRANYKAVEQHLAQAYGGSYDSKLDKIVGIPAENSKAWADATSIAHNIIGAASQEGITHKDDGDLPYGAVAKAVRDASTHYVSQAAALQMARKAAVERGAQINEEQLKAEADKISRASFEKWQAAAFAAAEDIAMENAGRRQSKGAAPAAGAPAVGKPPAAKPGTAAGPTVSSAQALAKAQEHFKSGTLTPAQKAAIRKRLIDQYGYTGDALKAAGL